MTSDNEEISLARDILDALYPFNLSIVGEDNDKFASAIQQFLDFKVIEFASGSSNLGWTIPEAWELLDFSLSQNGRLVPLDYNSPFIVSKNAKSVDIELTWGELQKHLCIPEHWQEDGLPYDWRNLYREISSQDWSISLTRKQFEALDRSAIFRVIIKSKFRSGKMKVLEAQSKVSDDSRKIFVNAHNCHPYQANDDISGIVAAILLHRRVSKRVWSKINLVTLIAPEILGPHFYLNTLKFEQKLNCYGGAILFKSIGNRGPLKLQEAFDDVSVFSRAARKSFIDSLHLPENMFKFRELYGNDEIVFECPPYKIPSITLTRFPFSSYHTSADTPANVEVSRIIEAVDVAENMLEILESNTDYQWNRTGLPKLNTAKHNLYRAAPMPGMSRDSTREDDDLSDKAWNLLMNSIPSLISSGLDTLTISERYRLNYHEVSEYLEQWVKAGHISSNKGSW